jgi:putative transposase
MYDWRKMTEAQRRELLEVRKAAHRPWHSPPHRLESGACQFIVSAACYEHAPIIGRDPDRMDQMAERLLEMGRALCDVLFAWCVLPNHYHLVVQTVSIERLLRAVGQLHGRTSYQWNGQEGCRGRQVWFSAVEREMRSDRHLWASINYVHHNPVKHGYVARWHDWPWSSARAFLEEVGEEQAKLVWREYPIRDYGKGWDDA